MLYVRFNHGIERVETTKCQDMSPEILNLDYTIVSRDLLTKKICPEFLTSTQRLKSDLLLWALHASFHSPIHLHQCLIHCWKILGHFSSFNFPDSLTNLLLRISILSYLAPFLDTDKIDRVAVFFDVPHIFSLPKKRSAVGFFLARFGPRQGPFLEFLCHLTAHNLRIKPKSLDQLDQDFGWTSLSLEKQWGKLPLLLHRSGFFEIRKAIRSCKRHVAVHTTYEPRIPTSEIRLPIRDEKNKMRSKYQKIAIEEILTRFPRSVTKGVPLGVLGNRLGYAWSHYNHRYEGHLAPTLRSFLLQNSMLFRVVGEHVFRVPTSISPLHSSVKKHKKSFV